MFSDSNTILLLTYPKDTTNKGTSNSSTKLYIFIPHRFPVTLDNIYTKDIGEGRVSII